MAIDAYGWNPRAMPAYDPPPPPPPPPPEPEIKFTSGFAAPKQNSPLLAEPVFAKFEPPPPPPPPPAALLSQDLTEQGHALAQKYGVGQQEQPDPRTQIVDLGKQQQVVDQQLDALLAQQVDVASAEQQAKAAGQRPAQFMQEITDGLSKDQLKKLQPLALAATQAKDSDRTVAQAEFAREMEAMLTPEQRQTLLRLNRDADSAHSRLQGQQIAKRIHDARASADLKGGTEQQRAAASEVLSLARADGRAFIAERQRVEADRTVQDLYATVMTAEVQQQLAPTKQELVAATNNLQQHPDDAQAKTRLEDAKKKFDAVFDAAINPQDRKALQGFEAEQAHQQSLAGILAEEASVERNFYDSRAIINNAGGDRAPTETQRRQFELAKASFELSQHNRGMRDLGLRVASTSDETELQTLHGQLDQSMIDSMKRKSDLNVNSQQFKYDTALADHATWQQAALAAPNAPENARYLPTRRAEGSSGAQVVFDAAEVSPTQKAVNDSLAALDAAKKERADLEQSLQAPEPEKKSGWDYALDIVAGVGEIIGGVATMAFFGWTGIGAVAGGAIVVDGLFRLGHSAMDAYHGTVTDAPLSALLQQTGMSQGAANRVDTGVNLLATAPVGIAGAGAMVLKSANILLKGSGALAGLMVIDGAQAQARYSVANQNATPITISQLTKAGLTPTQANYVLAAGNVVATGGLAVAAARTGPGKVHQQFRSFNDADAVAQERGIRTADWYSRSAPQDVRETIASQVLGRDATPDQIARLAKDLKSDALVVLRNGAGDDAAIIGGGSMRLNSAGHNGRDGLRNPLSPKDKAAELRNLTTDDDLIMKQVINAAALGAQEFTRQRTMFWQTQNPDETGLPAETEIKSQRITQGAPEVLRPRMNDDGFGYVKRAFEPDDKAWPTTHTEELHRLYRVPERYRVNWPQGSRDLIFETDLQRTLNPWERIVTPMHEQSLLGVINTRLNVVKMGIDYWERKWGSPHHAEHRPTLDSIDSRTGEPRDLLFYKRNSLKPPGAFDPKKLEPELRILADADVQTQKQFGDLASANRAPEPVRVEHAANNMMDRHVLAVRELDLATGDINIIGSASLVEKWHGFKGSDAVRFPFLEERDTPRHGTTYLSDVYGVRGGGRTAVIEAERLAKERGARYFEFITQWQGAQKLYNNLGAYGRGMQAPVNPEIAGLEMFEARFAADAGKRLHGQPVANLPQPLRARVANAASPEELQRSLDDMGTELYDLVGQTPNGLLMVSYRIDYGVPNNLLWSVKDAAWLFRNRVWEPAAAKVSQKLTDFADQHGPGFREKYYGKVPAALPRGIEPTADGARVQNFVDGVRHVAKEYMRVHKGAVVDAAGVQVATGDARIIHDDDRAIRPFNGLPGSDSVALYLPWTDTLITGWRTDFFQGRGPRPLDPNGLQPLARASAPLTDPSGPKGAGAMTAARFTGAEFNFGIRWFGNNDGLSAVTSGSVKVAAVNGNLRFDIPLREGGPRGVQALASVTNLMPSLSHAVYYDNAGLLMRNLHVTLSGSVQTSRVGMATKENAYRWGDHWTMGAQEVSGGTGFFFTFNPAYGTPNLS